MLEAARLAGAGIITALRGKQVVPSDVAFHSQQLGLLGSRPSSDQMAGCDTLLLLGTNYPYGRPDGRIALVSQPRCPGANAAAAVAAAHESAELLTQAGFVDL